MGEGAVDFEWENRRDVDFRGQGMPRYACAALPRYGRAADGRFRGDAGRGRPRTESGDRAVMRPAVHTLPEVLGPVTAPPHGPSPESGSTAGRGPPADSAGQAENAALPAATRPPRNPKEKPSPRRRIGMRRNWRTSAPQGGIAPAGLAAPPAPLPRDAGRLSRSRTRSAVGLEP